MSDMSKPVRMGFIGTGMWMDFSHLPIFKADSRVEMIAICGRNLQHAQEMATKYSIANVFTDYREMIEQADLDAIVVASPDDAHYSMTMDALDAGLHVLCEKPLALNESDAKAMYEKAESQGVRHMTFYTWRWMPLYRYIRELIDQGTIGPLYHCSFSFLMGFGRTTDYRWRFDRKRSSGVVGDFGSHMFDLARYFVGDISRVSAHLETHIQRESLPDTPLEPASDSAMAMLQFTNGAQGIVQVSAVARVADPYLEQRVTLHGEKGSLVADFAQSGDSTLRVAKGDEPFQFLPIPDEYLEGIDTTQPFLTQFASMFIHQPIGCRLFVDAILEQHPAVPSFYDGWKAQQVIDASIVSHETGQWVSIEEDL